MGKINNVSVQAMRDFADQIEKDPAAAKKLKTVTGRWNFDEGQPQFVAEVEYPDGSLRVETDFAPPMGGGGSRPDPVSYCLFGFASCFAGTYVSIAAEKGLALESLEITVENEVDLSRPMGVSDRPVTEGMNATLKVKANASEEQLERIRELAEERCPGVYCITNPIPFRSAIET